MKNSWRNFVRKMSLVLLLMGLFRNTFKYGDSWAWLVTTYCQVTWNQIHLLHLSSNLTWDFFKIILSEFETKSNSKRHTTWLTVTDSSHKVSTIKSIYINMKVYLLKDLSKNLIKYTNYLLARVKCECYSLVGHLQTLFRHVTADLLRRN